MAIAETQRDEAVQSVQALAKKVEMLRAATEPCPKYFSEYSIQKLKCFEVSFFICFNNLALIKSSLFNLQFKIAI